jgi:hypothetical protein
MGLSDWFRPKVTVDAKDFPTVVKTLTRTLNVMREEFLIGTLYGIKREGVQLEGVSSVYEEGSEIDSATKGFLWTCVLGFSMRYVDEKDWVKLEDQIKSAMAKTDMETALKYNEKYLDLEGNIDRLTEALAQDIHRLWGMPTPSVPLLGALRESAGALIILSQAATAAACKDTRGEKKLKGLLKIK